jgi:hypothetical protein
MGRAAAAAVLGVLVLAWPATGVGGVPFRGTVSPIGPGLREAMTGASWRPGCPVGLRDLRLVRVTHLGFDGSIRTGRLVVHEDVARPVVRIFRDLYRAGYPIRRMQLIDRYGASDYESIEADNTSAFNCRYVDGTTRWSEHAYGRAIDLNPIENPYVTSDGRVSHDASRRYVDRSKRLKGMVHAGDAVVDAFASAGWGWGGYWSGARDYQHFSASGN